MPHVGRYAPSPSGDLHVGNARTALLAWLWARGEGGGRFLLRIEDLDPDRSRPEIERRQIEDLAALGLDWDGTPVRQSERGALYERALEELVAAGLVYPCFCSRADVRAATVAPHGPGGAAYPGTCRGARPRRGRSPTGWRCTGEPPLPQRRRQRRPRAAALGRRRRLPARGRRRRRRARRDARAARRRSRTIDAEADRAVALARTRHPAALPARAARRRAGWEAPRQAPRGPFDTHDSRRLARRPSELVGWLACSAGLVQTPAPVRARDLVGAFDERALPSGPTSTEGNPWASGT